MALSNEETGRIANELLDSKANLQRLQQQARKAVEELSQLISALRQASEDEMMFAPPANIPTHADLEALRKELSAAHRRKRDAEIKAREIGL